MEFLTIHPGQEVSAGAVPANRVMWPDHQGAARCLGLQDTGHVEAAQHSPDTPDGAPGGLAGRAQVEASRPNRMWLTREPLRAPCKGEWGRGEGQGGQEADGGGEGGGEG